MTETESKAENSTQSTENRDIGRDIGISEIDSVSTNQGGEKTSGPANVSAIYNNGFVHAHVEYEDTEREEIEDSRRGQNTGETTEKHSTDGDIVEFTEEQIEAFMSSRQVQSDINKQARKAVLEPLFRITALVGVGITLLLTLASVVAGGYLLAAVFLIGTVFCIYAYQYDLPEE